MFMIRDNVTVHISFFKQKIFLGLWIWLLFGI